MEIENKWIQHTKDLIIGKTIKNVRYLTDKEKDVLGWYRKSIVLELEDGTMVYPSKDDEGNDAGALFIDNLEIGFAETIPVI